RSRRPRGGCSASRRPTSSASSRRSRTTSCARRTRSRPGEAMADEPLREALRDASRALVRRIEELSFVRSVGDVLAGAVEPAAVARALVGALRDELGADAAALWTVD